MIAMIMAAGLGTRLKPWTLEHPKALVPVNGVPALQRLILKLKGEGFNHIVVNVHHFAYQVKDFLSANDFGVRIDISDESERLLDTGGALVRALPMLIEDQPVLVHNVDIISNAPLASMVSAHLQAGSDVTLVTNDRDSSRKLLFDSGDILKGWHNTASGEYRPAGFMPQPDMTEQAFSGIYILNAAALRDMQEYAEEIGDDKFPVMDYFLSLREGVTVRRLHCPDLRMIDIGKPEALAKASGFIME